MPLRLPSFCKSLLILLFFCWQNVNSQSWMPAGGGIPKPTTVDSLFSMASAVGSGKLYLGYTQASPVFQTGKPYYWQFYEWDGFSWNQLVPKWGFASYPSQSASRLISMAYYKGQLYMGGFFARPFMTYDGNAWSDPGAWQASSYVNSMKVIDDRLYFVGEGDFYVAKQNNLKVSDVFYLEDTVYHALPALPIKYIGLNTIHRFNGDLYVAGRELAPFQTMGLLKLDTVNNQWVDPIIFADTTLHVLNTYHAGGASAFEYNGSLYLHTDLSDADIFKLSNDSLFYLGALEHNVRAVKELKGKIYFMGNQTSDSNTTDHYVTMFDGSSFIPVYNSPTHIETATVYNNELYAFSNRMDSLGGAYFQKAFRTNGDFPVQTIMTFEDLNGNCVRDTNEATLPNFMLKVDGKYLNTNGDGLKTLAFPVGTYQMDTAYSIGSLYSNMRPQCAIPTSLVMDTIWDTTYIGFYNPVAKDAGVKLFDFTGWRARRGFTELYRLDLSNLGTDDISTIEVEVDLPQGVTFIESTPQPTTSTPNKLTFNFNNIAGYDKAFALLKIKIDTSNALGDSLDFMATITNYAADTITSNNTYKLVQQVTAGFDPNDKLVNIKEIYRPDSLVNYRIRFQNTGNDTAYNVIIIDTINSSLSLNDLEVNGSSYPYSMILEDRVVKWKFDNISLPDSGTDFLGSQGFIDFSIPIGSHLTLGDTATNQASIYFDFAKPVITNNAYTVLASNVSIEEYDKTKANRLSIYPNPTADWFSLENSTDEKLNILLMNTNGQITRSFEMQSLEKIRLETANLSPGLYILWLSNKESYKLLVQ